MLVIRGAGVVGSGVVVVVVVGAGVGSGVGQGERTRRARRCAAISASSFARRASASASTRRAGSAATAPLLTWSTGRHVGRSPYACTHAKVVPATSQLGGPAGGPATHCPIDSHQPHSPSAVHAPQLPRLAQGSDASEHWPYSQRHVEPRGPFAVPATQRRSEAHQPQPAATHASQVSAPQCSAT